MPGRGSEEVLRSPDAKTTDSTLVNDRAFWYLVDAGGGRAYNPWPMGYSSCRFSNLRSYFA